MPKKLSTSEFIEISNIVHNNKYDYQKTNYIGNKINVIISCPIHGDFSISPNLHISRKSGCKKCSISNRSKERIIPISDYIKRVNIIHCNKYDYKLVKYERLIDIITIICPIHGQFEQKASTHLFLKRGCRFCYNDRRRSNLSNFIKKSKMIFGDKYDYSKFKYINSSSKSIIICKNNHEILTTPNRHLSGKTSCKECRSEKYKNRWIKILQNIEGFQYLNFSGEIVNINCLKCNNTFNRKCSAHLKLQNCPFCSPNKYDLEIFIKKSIEIHGDIFDYSECEYTNSKGKVKLFCKKGHEFYQNAGNHLNGTGCPKCNRFDIKQNEILNFVREFYSGEILTNSRTLDGKEIDIYLPELKLGFEFNGLYWHSELYKEQNYHLEKTDLGLRKGINLFHIWEDDWDNKQDILKSMILNKMGRTPNKIYARKCNIQLIDDNKLIREFLNKNHIQGFVGSKIKIGLFYNQELVSLMTFGDLRKPLGQKSEVGFFELLRFCNKLNTSVVGGASKLFKYFTINYQPTQVISYSDYSRSRGQMYQQLGFKLKHNSNPNYYYIIDGVRKHRFGFRKDKLVADGFDSLKTEIQIMNERGYYRIFDCGMQKWIIYF